MVDKDLIGAAIAFLILAILAMILAGIYLTEALDANETVRKQKNNSAKKALNLSLGMLFASGILGLIIYMIATGG